MMRRKKICTEYKSDTEQNDRHIRKNEYNQQRTKNSRTDTIELSDDIFYTSTKFRQFYFNSSHA